jgi:hypothetical protein
MLEGVNDAVVVSFKQNYRKTGRNLNAATRIFGFTWQDTSDEVKHSLLA